MFHRPKRILGFAAAVWLVLAGGLVGQWHHAGRAAGAARAGWVERTAERERLARAVPAATPEGSAEVDEAVTQAEAELAARRQALTGPSTPQGGAETPLESWFEVTAAAERLRMRAEEAGVALAAGEHFGLATYRRQGPAATELATVGRQSAVLEHLLGTLFNAHPHALLSVQRERPDGADGGEPADFFRMEPQLSVRAPGLLDATAFRFEFTGRTEVLRAFLEDVIRSPASLLIRSVEVAPLLTDVERAPRPAADTDPALRPVVVPGLSRFIVTVEHVVPQGEIMPAPGEAAIGMDRPVSVDGGARAEERRWRPPPAQPAGPGWGFEVFTPPALHYDRLTGIFSVAPTHGAGSSHESLPVELLAVKREPFRLQLAGYSGAPGNWLGFFTSPASAETLLARPGHRFEELGLSLKSLDVTNRRGGPASDPRAEEVAGVAVLHDEKSGREVVLESRDRLYSEPPLALLRLTDAAGSDREVREGETWSDGHMRYRIERIQLDPPEVVIVREAPGSRAPVTAIIRPAGAASAGGSQPDRLPEPPAKRRSPPALATNP